MSIRFQLHLVRVVLLAAATLLGLGLVAPCMTIVPGFGEFEGWVRVLKPELKTTSVYSVLSGILAMIRHGSVGVGVLLLAFSVCFPVIKLAVMAWSAEAIARRYSTPKVMMIAHHAGKFSMLDVLVIALIVIAVKGLPGNTQIELQWGVWAFAASVVLSMLASILLAGMEQRARAAS
jgi:paraquat-inducible protein A